MIKIAEIILLACMAVSMIACIILSLQRAIYQDQVQNLQPLFGSISMLSLVMLLILDYKTKENKMSLKTLEHVKEIGGFGVNHWDSKREYALSDINEKSGFIQIDHDENKISFIIQDRPIQVSGINGCQVDTIIEAAKLILEGLNEQHYCYQNDMAINKLERALQWLRERTADRVQRGVEGHPPITRNECPYCKSMNRHVIAKLATGADVHCAECGTATNPQVTIDEAIKAWNEGQIYHE